MAKQISTLLDLFAALTEIQPAMIVKTYSGKPGCMCGCRGTYTEGSKGSRKLKNMIMVVDVAIGLVGTPDELNTHILDGTDLDGNRYLSIETDDRSYTVYFKGAI